MHFENQTKEIYINVKQTCKEFKLSMKEFAGLPANKLRMYYSDTGSPTGLEELKFPNKVLYSLNVKDGDEFFFDRK